jgi:hypothetical protein
VRARAIVKPGHWSLKANSIKPGNPIARGQLSVMNEGKTLGILRDLGQQRISKVQLLKLMD